MNTTLLLDADRPTQPSSREKRERLISIVEARIILTAFLATFIASRTLVHLMTSHRVPELYLHVGPEQTHVHHLNYGIFLLSFIGAYLIFVRPRGRHMNFAAAIYGVAMGLTFDEFGMWYHLSGNYWQQASYDAIMVIGLIFALLALGPELRRLRSRGWIVGAVTVMAVVVFAIGMRTPMKHALHRWGPELHHFAIMSPRR
ncbi:MAG TPA: hypothetical protein VFE47_16935 [Tepidisphaeraceae bacterium]|jgi:hypothetical protein|nr:hypothetical protein [Tepidisphaeraceae bacterium]